VTARLAPQALTKTHQKSSKMLDFRWFRWTPPGPAKIDENPVKSTKINGFRAKPGPPRQQRRKRRKRSKKTVKKTAKHDDRHTWRPTLGIALALRLATAPLPT